MPGIRSRLSYANVMVTALAIIVLGGGSALASVIISSNSQVARATISGHAPPAGDHSNLIGGSVNGTDLAAKAVSAGKLASNSVNSGKVTDSSLHSTDIGNGAIGASKIGTLPAVHADRSTNQTIPSGTTQFLALDEEQFDTDSMHDSTASGDCTDASAPPTVPNDCRVTAAISGIYQIDANIEWASPFAARTLTVLKNRAFPLGSAFAGSGADSSESISTLAELSAGDYVELAVEQVNTSGDPIAVNSETPTPELSLHWLSPG